MLLIKITLDVFYVYFYSVDIDHAYVFYSFMEQGHGTGPRI